MASSTTPTTTPRYSCVAFTGGGTGGHFYPAVAVAEALLAKGLTAKVIYVGDKRRIEGEKVPAMGWPFVGLTVSGMPRQLNPLAWWRWWQALQTAKQECLRCLQQEQPAFVFASGGYASAPLLMAAQQLKIPFVLHEPDARPGLVNRWMASKAALVTSAFDSRELRSKAPQYVVTGNPLRGNMGKLTKTEGLQALGLSWPEDKPVLLLMGGSLGARALNQALLKALPTLLNELGVAVLHQTGPKLFEETKAAAGELVNHPHYEMRPYFESMAPVWAVSQFAVCRAGSLSLSELALAGIPGLLVPYPYAAANHQWHNAKSLADRRAATLLEESGLTPEPLIQWVETLLQDPIRYESMALAMKEAATPDAVEQIIQAINTWVSS
jgi:UDP-N-acetylglucosamine--N-acetylmuramyl-(pentapeptide) pyrophosphoryl-undecaprenol N-acetylglucosamine transferase